MRETNANAKSGRAASSSEENPEVETEQLESLAPRAAAKMTGGDMHRDHFQVDADDMGDLLPSANDEDR